MSVSRALFELQQLIEYQSMNSRIHSNRTIKFQRVIWMSIAFYEGTDQFDVIQCIRIRTHLSNKNDWFNLYLGNQIMFLWFIWQRGSTFTFMFRSESKAKKTKIKTTKMWHRKNLWMIDSNSLGDTHNHLVGRMPHTYFHFSIIFIFFFVCFSLESFSSIWQTSVSAMEQT